MSNIVEIGHQRLSPWACIDCSSSSEGNFNAIASRVVLDSNAHARDCFCLSTEAELAERTETAGEVTRTARMGTAAA
jgi:hypothetical protein